MSKIQWLELKHFIELQAEFERSGNVLQENISVNLTFKEMDSIINRTPYYAEHDDVGKTVTWFAHLKNQAFYIMSFHDSPYPKTSVACGSFEILTELEDLGASFFKNITWINNYPENAVFSVFTYDRSDIKVEVYRADSKEEADTTAFFLNTRGQTDTFFVDVSEDLDLKWLVFEAKDGEELEIARYVDRLSAEYFVKDYRTKTKNKITLRQEDR